MFLSEPKDSGQFSHHTILEMTTMVSDNHFRDTESCDNLVENEKRCSFPVSFKGGHCLYPFHEIIYSDNDMFVPPS